MSENPGDKVPIQEVYGVGINKGNINNSNFAKMIDFRLIDDETEINCARSLLHDVLIEEEQWTPEKNNPSGLYVKTLENGKKILKDDYDDHADWVGGYVKNELCVCFRSLRAKDGKYELEHYFDFPPWIREIDNKKELNRLAIKKDIRKNIAVVFETIKYAAILNLEQEAFNFTTTNKLNKIFNLVGIQRSSEPPFKYHDNDDSEVELFTMTNQQAKKVIASCDEFLKRKNRRGK